MNGSTKTMITMSFVGSPDELFNLTQAMKANSWKLTYIGSSDTWMAEPVYEIKQAGQVPEEQEEWPNLATSGAW